MIWNLQYGANVERLEAAAAKGARVPALLSRPELSLWLLPAFDAWVDLGANAPWWRVREWAEFYGVDFQWLLPVLRIAANAVADHKEKTRKTKRVGPSRNRPARGH